MNAVAVGVKFYERQIGVELILHELGQNSTWFCTQEGYFRSIFLCVDNRSKYF